MHTYITYNTQLVRLSHKAQSAYIEHYTILILKNYD